MEKREAFCIVGWNINCCSHYGKKNITVPPKNKNRTSLLEQWIRIHRPMQGTQVRSLVWADPIGCITIKPTSQNYWACKPYLLKPEHPRACALQQERPPQWEASVLPLGKACMQQWRPSATKKSKRLLATQLLGHIHGENYYLNGYRYPSVHGSTIYNCEDMEAN